MSAAIEGVLYVLSHFPSLLIGVAGGILVGALPGLSGSTGIILLLPFLVYLEPAEALIMMSGMFCGSMYGGSISAILISTPGTPSAAATVLDGYPLVKKGQAGKAIAVSTIASTVGGIVSTLCLILLAPQLAKIALKFGPEEYFSLMIFGLTIMASISSASLLKGLLSGFFGLILAMVGLDPILGTPRFTFGITRLLTGFPMVPVLIGLFAFSEIFKQLESVGKTAIVQQYEIKGRLPTWKELKGLIKVIFGSSLLGTAIGIIPATGGAIASFMAYNETRRFSKHPETFGTGELAGIAAPEAANNGTTGGAMIPMLTLGIPGDVVTAVMLELLLIIGVRPDRLILFKRPRSINALFAGFMLAQFLILVLGLSCLPPLSESAEGFPSYFSFYCPIPLLPGSFFLLGTACTIWFAIVFADRYFMKRLGSALHRLILGLILGPLVSRVSPSLIISHGDWTVLFKSLSLSYSMGLFHPLSGYSF